MKYFDSRRKLDGLQCGMEGVYDKLIRVDEGIKKVREPSTRFCLFIN